MPETEYEFITKEWMQAELRSFSVATATAATLNTSASNSSASTCSAASGSVLITPTTSSTSATTYANITSSDVTSAAAATAAAKRFCDRDHDNDHYHQHVDHAKDLIILDCRSSNEFSECHIRSAVNFSIPSIMLRRLAAGKIDLLSTIKSNELKERIQNGYKVSLFVLYNDVGVCNTITTITPTASVTSTRSATTTTTTTTTTATDTTKTTPIIIDNKNSSSPYNINENMAMDSSTTNTTMRNPCLMSTIQNLGGISTSSNMLNDTSTINILYKRLKQDGCRVVALQDGFASFRQAFPEWCEDDNMQNKEMESSRNVQADQLMGLRSLRISTPHSDSACSSSAESSDCEGTTHSYLNEAPVEIIPGLFLGNVMHSCDARALQKYNIKYILNVTKDLPNVFEASGSIQYLQIPITDHYSQDLAIHFPAAIQFIEEARSNNSAVLVHCLAGVSRSVTVTLAYLMRKLDLSLNDAFTLVRDRKPDVSPNFHFMQQLHSFERQLGLHSRRYSNSSTNINRISNSSSNNECMMDAMMDSTINSGNNGETANTSMMSSNTKNMTNSDLNLNVNVATSLHCAAAAVAASNSATISGCNSKFTCNCLATECKCLSSTDSYLTQLAKAANSGISPDSGIEFDRWTPSASDTSLK